MCDPADPLSVSVRANDLAEGQLPHLRSVLLSLDAVYVPAPGTWSVVSTQTTARVINLRTDYHLHKSATRVNNRLESHRSPDLQSQSTVNFPHQRVPPKRSHDQLTRCYPIHLPPPSGRLSFRAPSVSPSAPQAHFPSQLESPPRCLSP